jgi:hypothetical protein
MKDIIDIGAENRVVSIIRTRGTEFGGHYEFGGEFGGHYT